MPERELEREAEDVLRGILDGLADVHVKSCVRPEDAALDLTMDVVSSRARFRFAVQAKSRVTPQTALSACHQFRRVPTRAIPVIFAPTISPRVAEILRTQGVGYADRAGNCWLRSPHDHLLIERQGFRARATSHASGGRPLLDEIESHRQGAAQPAEEGMAGPRACR